MKYPYKVTDRIFWKNDGKIVPCLGCGHEYFSEVLVLSETEYHATCRWCSTLNKITCDSLNDVGF